MNTTIIAHRGASDLVSHDNTIEAFQIAIDIQADSIELDVRQTLDKVLIVFHDEEINGHTIRTLTYKQVNEIAAESDYQIPTLEEVLLFCQGKIHLLIELKEAGYEKRVLALVNSLYDYTQYAIQSFLDIVVRRIKKIDPMVNTGLLLGEEHADFSTRFNEYYPGRRFKECHADFISAHYKLATPDFILRMNHAQIPLNIWTVDNVKSIQYFLEFEINGIITNRPDVGVFLRNQYIEEEKRSAEKRTKTKNLFQKAVTSIPLKKQKKQ